MTAEEVTSDPKAPAASFTEYPLVPGILSVRSNVSYVPGFFAERLVPFESQEPPQITIDLEVTGRRFGDGPYELTLSHIHGDSGGRRVLFHQPTGIPGFAPRLHLEDLSSPNPRLTANRSYRLPRIAIGAVRPLGVHLRDVVTTSLLQHGYVPLHAAAFARRNDAVLIVGPSNVGKTTTVIKACQEGFDFLGEDVVVSDGSDLYAFPLTPGLGHGVDNSGFRLKKRRLWIELWLANLFYHRLPFLNFLPVPVPELNILSLDPAPRIAPRAKAQTLVLLAHSPETGVTRMAPEQALRHILTLNRMEFHYQRNKVLLAYSYLNSDFDLASMDGVERDKIASLVANSECYVCQVDTPLRAWELIRDHILNGR